MARPKSWPIFVDCASYDQKLRQRGKDSEKIRFEDNQGLLSPLANTQEELSGKIVPKALLVKTFLKSCMDMLRRRKVLTETDVRNFLNSCRYLLEQEVTLEDFKLSNLFLAKSMELIGDLGLTTRMAYEGQRKQAFCGTPNYVASERFAQLLCTGESFEVDVMAIGCIFFPLLVRHPPFESSTFREAYDRMRKNAYSVPSGMTSAACNLLQHLLHLDPQSSSSLEAILQDKFFTYVLLPPRLQRSSLTTQTHFYMTNASSTANRQRQRQLTATALSNPNEDMEPKDTPGKNCPGKDTKQAQWKEPQIPVVLPGGAQSAAEITVPKMPVIELKILLRNLCDARPAEVDIKSIQAQEDPTLTPVFWINKWVDYADKYGIGYQLCDHSIGVLFNDDSRVALDTASGNLMHIEKNGLQIHCSLEEYPQALAKKIILIKHFCKYMDERLQAVGDDPRPRQCNIDGQPFVRKWIRTSSTMSFYFSNGTFQVNFQDHTKVIICPLMGVVSYIDKKRVFHTYRLQSLHSGCPPDIFCRLKYARKLVDQLDSAST